METPRETIQRFAGAKASSPGIRLTCLAAKETKSVKRREARLADDLKFFETFAEHNDTVITVSV